MSAAVPATEPTATEPVAEATPATTTETPAETPSSPTKQSFLAKLFASFKKEKAEKKEKKEEAKEETTAAPAEDAAPVLPAPVVDETPAPAPAAEAEPATAPAAAEPEAPKEEKKNRRLSARVTDFFKPKPKGETSPKIEEAPEPTEETLAAAAPAPTATA